MDIIIKGCEPTVSFDSYITTIDGKNLVVIEISPGILRPYYIKGGKPKRDTFLRTSASNRTPSDGMLKELELEGARRSFDSLKYIERYDTFEKDAESLCQYISRKSGKDVDFNKLENLGLIINTPSGYVPSRAFVLLRPIPIFTPLYNVQDSEETT